MSVSIAGIVDWADWPYSGDTAFDVRAVSTQSWITDAGEFVPGGQPRIVGTGTIAGVRATLPAITLPATDIGQDIQTSKFTVTAHRTGKDELVLTVLDQFTVPNAFSPSTNWGNIRINKNGKIPYRSTSVYTKEEVNNLLLLQTQGMYTETPAGVINGVNGTFTLSHTPITGSVLVFLNGNLQPEGSLGAGTESYTISGATITHLLPPQIGDRLVTAYRTTGGLVGGGSIPTQLQESGGPTTLSLGAIADLTLLQRSGSTIIGTIATRRVSSCIYNVKSYGALGNGAANDKASIQSAIDAAKTDTAGHVEFPPGTYNVATALSLLEIKGVGFHGAGPDNTKIVATGGEPAVQCNGIWRSHFEGIQFKTTAALATQAVFELDGNYDGTHTQGVQGVTFDNVMIDAANLAKYAIAVCRQGTNNGQGSENIFINLNVQSAIRAGYFQEGANALNNLFLGGNWQDMPKYGVELRGGSATFIKPAFQNLVNLVDAITNNAYDIVMGDFGTAERITIIDPDSESVLFLLQNTGAQTACVTGLTHRGKAAGDSWGALVALPLKYTFAGTTALGNQKMFKITTAGTTGAAQPTWPESGTVADGSVTWTQVDFSPITLISGHVTDSLFGRGAQAKTVNNTGAFYTNNRFTRKDYKESASAFGRFVDNYMLDGVSFLVPLDNPTYNVATPAQITSNQNNYTPANGYVVRLSTDASRNITGMVFTPVQGDGESHLLVNVGAQDVVLKHQDGASTDVNRFLNSTGADITLTANQSADANYDGTTDRWRVFKRS